MDSNWKSDTLKSHLKFNLPYNWDPVLTLSLATFAPVDCLWLYRASSTNIMWKVILPKIQVNIYTDFIFLLEYNNCIGRCRKILELILLPINWRKPKKRSLINFFQQIDGVRIKSRNNSSVDTNVNCLWTWKREKNNDFTIATEGIFWANLKMKLFFCEQNLAKRSNQTARRRIKCLKKKQFVFVEYSSQNLCRDAKLKLACLS